jgi:hypothetical protein
MLRGIFPYSGPTEIWVVGFEGAAISHVDRESKSLSADPGRGVKS